MMQVDGCEFAKIAPHDQSFIKLTCEGIVERVPRNATPCQCEGVTEPLGLRNQKQREEFDAAAPRVEPCGLFGEPPVEEKAKKRIRSSRAQLRELRQSPGVLSLEVPAVEEHGEPVANQGRKAFAPMRRSLC